MCHPRTCEMCGRALDHDEEWGCFENNWCEDCQSRWEEESALRAWREYCATRHYHLTRDEYRDSLIDAGRGHLLHPEER